MIRVPADSSEFYIYLGGLSVSEPLRLNPNVELLPANPTIRYNDALEIAHDPLDLAAILLFIPSVHSQLRITSSNDRQLAIATWNSLWNAVLLSALLNTEISFGLQADRPADSLEVGSKISRIGDYLYGAHISQVYQLSQNDRTWIKTNYSSAESLMEFAQFSNAVHCLHSFRWHSMPSVQLAVLWSGIEGLFSIQQELVFRLSLCIAHFLEESDRYRRIELYKKVKKLYGDRSKAVHGTGLKGKTFAVGESARLLNLLIKRCAELGVFPDCESILL